MPSNAHATDDHDIEAEFSDLVNMTPKALHTWLETDESRSVGIKSEGSTESTGHRSGRHIVKLLETKKSDYTDADRTEMHRIVGYIKRHLAQRPSGDTSETRWAFSLKNWGHDPAKT